MAIAKAVTQNTARPPKRRSKTKTIELVLGGGGVKGFAHVGFLKAVEQLKINYGMITGVSIGTIIAVLYVNGFSTSEIEIIFAQELEILNRKKLTRSMLLPAALDRLIFGNGSASLLALMTDLVARYHLKPKRNLRLVAYNPLTRKPVIFSGTDYDLAKAMAASCAIPFVFQPIENGEETSLLTWLPRYLLGGFLFGRNELLVDGGLFHPAPTDFCQGPAIVAKLGFASESSSENLDFTGTLFHNAERAASSFLDLLFPDPEVGGEHLVINVGRSDVAALSFGISHRQQKSLTAYGYRRSISALKTAVAQGRVPVKQ